MAKHSTTTTAYEATLAKIQELIRMRDETQKDESEARSQGDLRENFGFQAAKMSKQNLNTIIGNLQKTLQSVTVDPTLDLEKSGSEHAATGTVGLGTHVTLNWELDEETEIYRVVTALDEPGETKNLKNNSPLGERILGKKVGEKISFRGDTITIVAVEATASKQQ